MKNSSLQSQLVLSCLLPNRLDPDHDKRKGKRDTSFWWSFPWEPVARGRRSGSAEGLQSSAAGCLWGAQREHRPLQFSFLWVSLFLLFLIHCFVGVVCWALALLNQSSCSDLVHQKTGHSNFSCSIFYQHHIASTTKCHWIQILTSSVSPNFLPHLLGCLKENLIKAGMGKKKPDKPGTPKKEGARAESWAPDVRLEQWTPSTCSSDKGSHKYVTPRCSLLSVLWFICQISICLGTGRRDAVALGCSQATSPCSWDPVLKAMLLCCTQCQAPFLGRCQMCSLLWDFHMLGWDKFEKSEGRMSISGDTSLHKYHLTERRMVSSTFRESSWTQAQKFSAAIVTQPHCTETFKT